MTTAYAAKDSLADIFKNVYGDTLVDQFDTEPMTYNDFPVADPVPGGNGYVFGMRYARGQGNGGRVESARLPDPLTGKKDQGTITPRYLYQSMRITGPAIAAGKGNKMAFVNSLADEVEDTYRSMIDDLNRQCHWDGFGQLGRLSIAATYTGNATWAGTFDNDIGVMYFSEGQMVDMYASAGDTLAGNTTVSCAAASRILSINPATKTVIFEAPSATYLNGHPYASGATNTNAVAIPIGAMAVKMGARDMAWTSADTPAEITGLLGLYDDGTLLSTFEGIVVATYPQWKANIISNAGVNRELSLDLMMNACDLSRMKGQKVTKIRMGMGQRRKYANLLMPDVRFAPTVLKGGYETLTFSQDASIEIFVDPLTQPNKMFFEPTNVIEKYIMQPLGWINLDGDKLHQRQGYDEYDAALRVYLNLGLERRNGLTLLSDLSEPSMY